jgi:hypothetical protein
LQCIIKKMAPSDDTDTILSIRPSGTRPASISKRSPALSRQRNDRIFKGRNVAENEGTTLRRNVGVLLSTATASYPRRTESSTRPLCKRQNSHLICSFPPSLIMHFRPLRLSLVTLCIQIRYRINLGKKWIFHTYGGYPCIINNCTAHDMPERTHNRTTYMHVPDGIWTPSRNICGLASHPPIIWILGYFPRSKATRAWINHSHPSNRG